MLDENMLSARSGALQYWLRRGRGKRKGLRAVTRIALLTDLNTNKEHINYV